MIRFDDSACRDGMQFTIRSDMPIGHLDLLCVCAPDWARSMYAAVRHDGCDYMLVTQGVGEFTFQRRRAAPRMLVIGDDFGIDGSQGPAGFHVGSIRSFLDGCAMAVIVSGAPNPADYAMAASVSSHCRRDVVLIETLPLHEGDWLHAILEAAPGIDVRIASSTDPEDCR